MRIFVAEQGCYENRCFAGVFVTVVAAMTAFPKGNWTRSLWFSEGRHYQDWSNNLDWDDHVDIHESTAAGIRIRRRGRALYGNCPAEVQLYDAAGHGWEYRAISGPQADAIMAGDIPVDIAERNRRGQECTAKFVAGMNEAAALGLKGAEFTRFAMRIAGDPRGE